MKQQLELEVFYQRPDPFGYQTNPDDIVRREKIVGHCKYFLPGGQACYERALDIAAGEAWVSQMLPAASIEALEFSKLARSRMPAPVKPVVVAEGEYDLVVCTGAMYDQYDWQIFADIIRKHAVGLVLTSNIQAWEVSALRHQTDEFAFLNGKQIYAEVFPYRQYQQQLRVFKL